jgi:hypothetical protein
VGNLFPRPSLENRAVACQLRAQASFSLAGTPLSLADNGNQDERLTGIESVTFTLAMIALTWRKYRIQKRPCGSGSSQEHYMCTKRMARDGTGRLFQATRLVVAVANDGPATRA